MASVPIIPDHAPFNAEQRAWLNGYLAGLFARGSVDPIAQPAAVTKPVTAALKPLTILFGSQTGTSETLAKKAAKEAGRRGFVATVRDMAAFTLAQLSQEENVLVITSTYGEGEPPDNARALHAALAATEAAPLPALRFSVCGLGDTNYAQFCQCAKDFDVRLEKLGATRITARVDCDLDYEKPFTQWLDDALSAFGSAVGAKMISTAPEPVKTVTSEDSGYSRSRPYPALLLTSRNLNAADSAKQVHHVEFDLADSGLTYEAGDALGVYAHNCPDAVAEILAALGCDGEEAVTTASGETTLRIALTQHCDLGKPSAELLTLLQPTIAVAAATGGPTSPATPAPHHVIDALLAATARPSPSALVSVLRKIQPRLYSISSSPHAHTGQVHLTVGAVRYDHAGRSRKGVCSTFLADRVSAGASRVGVFVHRNQSFRPPAQGDVPMIMVGPGTGIAPFRAFLHDRRATGATGKNWLFFGDQRAASDFLYADELAALQKDGLLTRLDTAFSRDQAEKVYVQHRMRENAAELYAWLEAGAHFYVCGDAARMAKDVDAALHEVVALAGKKSREAAADYVNTLRSAKRYQRDVY